MDITIKVIRSVVEKVYKMHQVPELLPLSDLGINYAEVIQLKRKIFQLFNQTIEITTKDSIESITKKLTSCDS